MEEERGPDDAPRHGAYYQMFANQGCTDNLMKAQKYLHDRMVAINKSSLTNIKGRQASFVNVKFKPFVRTANEFVEKPVSLEIPTFASFFTDLMEDDEPDTQKRKRSTDDEDYDTNESAKKLK